MVQLFAVYNVGKLTKKTGRVVGKGGNHHPIFDFFLNTCLASGNRTHPIFACQKCFRFSTHFQ